MSFLVGIQYRNATDFGIFIFYMIFIDFARGFFFFFGGGIITILTCVDIQSRCLQVIV